MKKYYHGIMLAVYSAISLAGIANLGIITDPESSVRLHYALAFVGGVFAIEEFRILRRKCLRDKIQLRDIISYDDSKHRRLLAMVVEIKPHHFTVQNITGNYRLTEIPAEKVISIYKNTDNL